MRTILILLLIFLTSCQQESSDEKIRKSNLELTSRYFNEVYNQNNIDLIDELFVENYEHTSTEGRKFNSRDELKSAVKRIESLLPNLKLEIVEAVADTEKVIFLVGMVSSSLLCGFPIFSFNLAKWERAFLGLTRRIVGGFPNTDVTLVDPKSSSSICGRFSMRSSTTFVLLVG